MMGGQLPSHHDTPSLVRLGHAYTSKTEVELSGPRAIVLTNMLYSPKTPTYIRSDKDGLRFASMVGTHGQLLSVYRALRPDSPVHSGAAQTGKESPVTAAFYSEGRSVNRRNAPFIFFVAQSNRSPCITRNWRRRCVGVGVGFVGTALSAASISSLTDHT